MRRKLSTAIWGPFKGHERTLRTKEANNGDLGSTLAAIPVLSPIRPSRICSVPTKLWPSRLASSCASITTLIAFSVNRSNMALVVTLPPRLPADFDPYTTFCPNAKLDLNPVNVVRLHCARALALTLATLLALGGARTALLPCPKPGKRPIT